MELTIHTDGVNAHITLSRLLLSLKNEKKKGVVFISGAENELLITYSELLVQALLMLRYLQINGVKPKDEVVFQMDDNKAFLVSFWACVLGGFKAIPLPPGQHGESEAKLARVCAVLDHPFILTTQSLRQKTDKLLIEHSINARVLVYECISDQEEAGELYEAQEDDIAFIQFSSGSTGHPKGVMLSHKNLLTNITAIIEAAELKTTDRLLSWMPLTHDMGLIGFHLVPVAMQAQLLLMPTDLFVRYPLIWMRKASEHRINITSSPNYGYQHFLNQFNPANQYDFDLSSLRILFNGAEPIMADVCRNFTRALQPYGLAEGVMFTVYGLAEASLAVTFPAPEKPFTSLFTDRKSLGPGDKVKVTKSSDGIELINCGKPVPYCELAIRNSQGEHLEDGCVGYIHIKGDNVTQGYYHNPEATQKSINQENWLNTDDLGFIHEGNLYVTGRMKELIFIAGQNVYPHDIERIAQQIEGIEAGKVIACGIPDAVTGTDSLVLFVLFKKNLDEFYQLTKKLKRHIASQTGIEVKFVVPIKKVPKTTSGKIKRVALADDFSNGTFASELDRLAVLDEQAIVNTSSSDTKALGDETVSVNRVIQWFRGWLAKRLGIGVQEVDVSRSFAEQGVTSLIAVDMARAIETELGLVVEVTSAWNYPTIDQLSNHLVGQRNQQTISNQFAEGQLNEPLAIIGMACRFPGAETLEDFWSLLENAQNTASEAASTRWDAVAVERLTQHNKNKTVTRGNYLQDIDRFDAGFFGISPKEACAMDPQQRILLETTWQALEDAGVPENELSGRDCGVFIGVSHSDYAGFTINDLESLNAYSGTGNALSIVANRLSYVFNLTGPSMAVDTACSSSLVALHQACQHIRLNECSMAIVGGINLIVSPALNVVFSQANMLSSDGVCKTFDNDANGYSRGEGCGVVVIKRLSDAVRDGDTIQAVVRGSAVNQDGRSNGLTAPNGLSQKRVIERALQAAQVKASDIDYIETHGTGTPLGDPVEFQALADVLGQGRSTDKPCWIGSVKTNIGHLESAAGIAGLIKTVLSLTKNLIPKHLNFEVANTYLNYDAASFLKVANKSIPWLPEAATRKAGVSSFGFGGTNAHVILEEARPYTPATPASELPSYPFMLSAKTDTALQAMVRQYGEFLQNTPLSFSDICHTLACSRSQFPYRLAFTASSKEDAIEQLRQPDVSPIASANPTSIAFYFPDYQALVRLNVSKVYDELPSFRHVVEQSCQTLGIPVSSVLTYEEKSAHENSWQLAFLKGYVLAAYLADLGLAPDSVSGVGVGEILAACTAGVISAKDGYALAKAADLAADGNAQALNKAINAITLNQPQRIINKAGTANTLHTEILTKAYWKEKLVKADPAVPTETHILPDELSIDVARLETVSNTGSVACDETNCLLADLNGSLVVEKLTGLYQKGLRINWAFFLDKTGGKKVSLPGYPFERKPYWVAPTNRLEWLPKELPVTDLLSQDADHSLEGHVYVPQWISKDLESPVSTDKRTWLIFAEKKDLGAEIAKSVDQKGQKAIQIFIGNQAGKIDDCTYQIDRYTPDVLQILHRSGIDSHAQPIGFAYLWTAEANTNAHDPETAFSSYGHFLNLVRVLGELPASDKTPLWVITQSSSSADRLLESPYWGFAKSAWLEYPKLKGGLITTDSQTGSAAANQIVDELLRVQSEDSVRFSHGKRLVYRLKKEESLLAPPVTLERTGLYLITGGLGFLGTRFLSWMVSHGAQHIVLTTRQNIPPEATWETLPEGFPGLASLKQVRSLRQAGIDVTIVQVNVSSHQQVSEFFASVKANGLDLKGVVHAAGDSEYRSIEAIDQQALRRILQPKLVGGWNLHQLTKELELQFFICLSSVTSIWGGKNQALYAAANQFLDGLSTHRHALGLSTLTLNLGPVTGGGMADTSMAMFDKVGIRAVEAAALFPALDKLIGSAVPQAVLASIDWNKFEPVYRMHSVSPILAGSEAPKTGEVGEEIVSESVKNLKAMFQADKYAYLVQLLNDKAATVLGYKNGDRLPIDVGLFDLGLDSLTALSLKESIEQELQVKLIPTVAFNYPTIHRLADYLITEHLSAHDEKKPEAMPDDHQLDDQLMLVADGDSFTDAELESILNEQISKYL